MSAPPRPMCLRRLESFSLVDSTLSPYSDDEYKMMNFEFCEAVKRHHAEKETRPELRSRPAALFDTSQVLG